MNESPLSLFRQQAVAAHGQLRGDVLVTSAAVHWPAIISLVALVGVLFGALAFGTYARTDDVPGQLTTDGPTTKIVPTRPGIVSTIHVREGEVVAAGQKLATIVVAQASPERQDPAGADVATLDSQRALVAHQVQIAKASSLAEAARLRGVSGDLNQQVAALERQIVTQKQLESSAKAEFTPLEAVLQRGFVSKVEFEQRRQAWLVQIAQSAQLDGQLAAMRGQLQNTKRQIEDLPRQLDNKLDDLQSSSASLTARRIEAESARAYVITAPVAGRVSGLQAGLGSNVSPQVTLMTIVGKHRSLIAELYAPSRAIGFARKGEEVRLIYDAFPAAKFGSAKGRVIDISSTVLDPNDITMALAIKEPVYRIRVGLSSQSELAFGKTLPLHPGMTLQGVLVAERSTFLEWLLQPVFAARARR